MALESIIANIITKRQLSWKLIDLDHKISVEGYYLPEGLAGDFSSEVVDLTALNQPAPFSQWLRANQKVWSFRSLLFARDSLSSVKEHLDALERLWAKDDRLYRPPVCRFIYGSEVAFTCIVRSFAIEYMEARPDGRLRGAIVSLTLHGYQEIEIGESQRLETYYRPIREGETYEEIALREYGDPSKGANLRMLQPSLSIELEAGELIKLPELESDEIAYDIELDPVLKKAVKLI